MESNGEEISRPIAPVSVCSACARSCDRAIQHSEMGDVMRIFKATDHQHYNYSGQFHLSGQKTTLIGNIQNRAPCFEGPQLQL